jgi:precorrin-3B synthase
VLPRLSHPSWRRSLVGSPPCGATYDPAVPILDAAERARVDACPGALTLHAAADGGLARVRLPGGLVSAAQLRVLAAAADDLGDGRVELTSRGNVQLRALAPGAELELGDRLAAAGLLPSATHERVRNIVASPLAGVDRTGAVDVPALVAAIDAELCARPRLAELPGRFLVAIDDGRGDLAVTGGADITVIATDDQVQVETFLVGNGQAATTVVELAEAFLDERAEQRSTAWRFAELSGGAEVVRDRFARARPELGRRPLTAFAAVAEPVGVVAQPDGRSALTVLAPLGRLSRAQVNALARHATGDRGARVTPWRSIVLPDLDNAAEVSTELQAAGLGIDADSRWYRRSACTGRPGCAKALADVQADARADALADMRAGALAGSGGQRRAVHWSGCSRRCGHPAGPFLDIVATEAGYVRTPAGDHD